MNKFLLDLADLLIAQFLVNLSFFVSILGNFVSFRNLQHNFSWAHHSKCILGLSLVVVLVKVLEF